VQPGIIIVSNRLPVSVKRVDGRLEYYPSVGGLATGLSSYANNKKNKWIGWPGIASDDLSEQDRIDITQELKKHNCYPVFLTQKLLDDYYNGFSNSVLWPAFHELEFPTDTPDNYWQAYKRVNAIFSEAILAHSPHGSVIWVHDYQLLLVPGMLRAKRADDTVGFFLHIPFPKPDIFLAIPHAQRLLTELLGGNLVGFHTESYVNNFLASCKQAGLGIVGSHRLLLPDRVVRVTDFPMGIDYGKFARATRQWSVRAEVLRLRLKYRGKRVILTVDRLDPTKGLVERLQAYRTLLKTQPNLRGKVVMVMLAVPSRTEIPEYQQLKRKLEKLVKTVNKEYGTLSWQPVDYMYKSVPFSQLAALYRRADVAFIAPIKDGMNLVAKEYLATQRSRRGVLILSETAGAAEELKDAIIVNPHQAASLVRGLSRALTTPPKELRRRAHAMQDHLAHSTVYDWAGGFMKSLHESRPQNYLAPFAWHFGKTHQREMLAAYRLAKERVILLDYDGVLVPFRGKPSDAEPGKTLKTRLQKISQQSGTHLAVISGRPKADLQTWLGELGDITLIAEHGAFVRKRQTKQWRSTIPKADLGWKKEAVELLQTYDAKTPGAHVEIKEASLVWHYRRGNQYYAHKHLVILKRLLWRLSKQYPIVVEQGNMILEIRLADVHKGTAALNLVTDKTDFVLAVGDDATDEDMFEHVPAWSYTVKIGRGRTKARFRLPSIDSVHELLARLIR
jgi:trehalose 6-phosphate synthase/phosphatase